MIEHPIYFSAADIGAINDLAVRGGTLLDELHDCLRESTSDAIVE